LAHLFFPLDIDNILEVVRKAGGEVPDDIDRKALQSDLELTVSIYWDVFAERHGRAKRRAAMKEAIDLARRLRSNLYGRTDHDLCVELDRFLRPGNLAAKETRFRRFLGVSKKVSPFDHLIGNLFWTFRKYFKIGKKYSKYRSKDAPDEQDPIKPSPFVSFAAAILEKFNIRRLSRPYSHHAIADALTRALPPTEKKRRKNAEKSL
jgi:hypothetical protein